MIFTFLKAVFLFTLHASDPHWTCEVAHRDPGVPATMLLYCAQTTPDGIEIISIGAYVTDPHAGTVSR